MTTALVLRCVRADMTSYEGFLWPSEGPVSCSDWDSTDRCGGGLHGWLWGEGHLDCCNYWRAPTSKWLVVEVDEAAIVLITAGGGGKCKFPSGNVVFCGERDAAVEYLSNRAPP